MAFINPVVLSANDDGIVLAFNNDLAVKFSYSSDPTFEFDAMREVYKRFTLLDISSETQIFVPKPLKIVDVHRDQDGYISIYFPLENANSIKQYSTGLKMDGIQSAYLLQRVSSSRADGLPELVDICCRSNVVIDEMSRIVSDKEKLNMRSRVVLGMDDLVRRNFDIDHVAYSVGLIHGIGTYLNMDIFSFEIAINQLGQVCLYSLGGNTCTFAPFYIYSAGVADAYECLLA